jgi:Mg2+ and Co2+ transporter CorA
MNDEEKKNRLMNSIVAFNFSVMIVCVGLYSLNFPRGLQNHWLQFPVLALLGIIVGGIAALITWKKFTR